MFTINLCWCRLQGSNLFCVVIIKCDFVIFSNMRVMIKNVLIKLNKSPTLVSISLLYSNQSKLTGVYKNHRVSLYVRPLVLPSPFR